MSPGISGKPDVITRNGSPAMWASMVFMRNQCEGGSQVVVAFMVFLHSVMENYSFLRLLCISPALRQTW